MCSAELSHTATTTSKQGWIMNYRPENHLPPLAVLWISAELGTRSNYFPQKRVWNTASLQKSREEHCSVLVPYTHGARGLVQARQAIQKSSCRTWQETSAELVGEAAGAMWREEAHPQPRHRVPLHLLPCGKRHFPGAAPARQPRSARAAGRTKDRQGRAVNRSRAGTGAIRRASRAAGAVPVSCPRPGMAAPVPGWAALLRPRWGGCAASARRPGSAHGHLHTHPYVHI